MYVKIWNNEEIYYEGNFEYCVFFMLVLFVSFVFNFEKAEVSESPNSVGAAKKALIDKNYERFYGEIKRPADEEFQFINETIERKMAQGEDYSMKAILAELGQVTLS